VHRAVEDARGAAGGVGSTVNTRRNSSGFEAKKVKREAGREGGREAGREGG